MSDTHPSISDAELRSALVDCNNQLIDFYKSESKLNRDVVKSLRKEERSFNSWINNYQGILPGQIVSNAYQDMLQGPRKDSLTDAKRYWKEAKRAERSEKYLSSGNQNRLKLGVEMVGMIDKMRSLGLEPTLPADILSVYDSVRKIDEAEQAALVAREHMEAIAAEDRMLAAEGCYGEGVGYVPAPIAGMPSETLREQAREKHDEILERDAKKEPEKPGFLSRYWKPIGAAITSGLFIFGAWTATQHNDNGPGDFSVKFASDKSTPSVSDNTTVLENVTITDHNGNFVNAGPLQTSIMGRIYGLPSDVKKMDDIKKAKNYPEFEKWMKSKGKGYGWKKAKDSKSKGVYIDFNPDTQIVKNNSGKPLTVIGEDGIPIELPGDYWDIQTTYKLIDQFENVGGSGKNYSWWVFNYTNSLPVNILSDSQFAAMKADPQLRAVEQAVNIGGYNSSKLATLPGTEWNRSILLSAGLPDIDKFLNESERQSKFYVAEKIGSKPTYVDVKVKKTGSLLSKGRVGTLAGSNGSEALANITTFTANDTIELFGPPENLTTDKPIQTYDQFMANKTKGFRYLQEQVRVAQLVDRDGNPNGTLNESDLIVAAEVQARAWIKYKMNKTNEALAGYYSIFTEQNTTDPNRTDAKANILLKRDRIGGLLTMLTNNYGPDVIPNNADDIYGAWFNITDDSKLIAKNEKMDTNWSNDVFVMWYGNQSFSYNNKTLTGFELYQSLDSFPFGIKTRGFEFRALPLKNTSTVPTYWQTGRVSADMLRIGGYDTRNTHCNIAWLLAEMKDIVDPV